MEYGVYKAEIVQTALGSSPGKGTPFVKITCRVHDETIDAYIYLTDKSMGRARKCLAACGFKLGKDKLGSLQGEDQALRGNEVQIGVYADDYGGVPRTKADIIIEDGGLSDEHIGKLDAALADESGVADDDDIPF